MSDLKYESVSPQQGSGSGRGGEGHRSSMTVAEGGRYDDLVAKWVGFPC